MLKVLSVATTLKKYAINFENSLKQTDLEYQLLGIGTPWQGWVTKKDLIVAQIQKEIQAHGPLTIIIICDAYDILVRNSPFIKEELIRRFQLFGKDILVSAEEPCPPGVCETLDYDYFKHQPDIPRRNHNNGGFVMGYAAPLLNAYEKALQLSSDDQVGWGKYMNLHPDQVAIDSNSTIIYNWSFLWQQDLLIDNAGQGIVLTYNSSTKQNDKSHPFFFHTPNMYQDIGRRYNKIGQELIKLPSFSPVTWHDILSEAIPSLMTWIGTLICFFLFFYSIYHVLHK